MKEQIPDLYRFHLWRANKFHTLFSGFDDVLFNKEVSGSFPTLGKLLLHIVNAERIWESRLTGNGPFTFGDITFDSFPEAGAAWQASAAALLAYVISSTESDLNQIIHYHSTKGMAFTNITREVLVHIVEHSAYHTGQIIANLRQLGLPTITTNYINYVREVRP